MQEVIHNILISSSHSRTKGTKNAYPSMLLPNTRGLAFVNDEQRTKYETLSTRKTNEQMFWHVESLRKLGMLDDVVTFLTNLGWQEYADTKCVSYDQLVVEFLSLLNVDWNSTHRGQEVLITFRRFNSDHRLSLR